MHAAFFHISGWQTMEKSIRPNKNVGISFYIQEKLTKVTAAATVCFVNSQLDYLLFLPVIGYFILFILIHYLYM